MRILKHKCGFREYGFQKNNVVFKRINTVFICSFVKPHLGFQTRTIRILKGKGETFFS